MGVFGGAALRFTSTLFFAIEFCCAAIILCIYSYFLARLSSNHLPISNDWKAIEGLSGAAVLYTIFAVLLTWFLGGVKFFAFLAIFFDILFCGAFVAIAILARGGASSCTGANINTPLGAGPSSENNPYYGKNNFGFAPNVNTSGYSPNLKLSCRLNTAAFAVAIIGALLILVSAAFQILVARHHQKEKKYGPSPANNYTSGSASNRKFWKCSPKTTQGAYARDVEQPVAAGPDMRHSQETGYTGTTMGAADGTQKPVDNPYGATYGGNETGNFHTGPRGTHVPNGYDANKPSATNF